jgi:hypothetical protein
MWKCTQIICILIFQWFIQEINNLIRKLQEIDVLINLKGTAERKEEELIRLYVRWKQFSEVPGTQLFISLTSWH